MHRRALVICLAVALVAPATADSDRRDRRTFEGSCRFSGTVTFEPPITTTPQPGRGFARARGPCTGTFTGENGRAHELDGDLVRYRAHNRGDISCGGGTATGGGFLRYRGDKLRFRLTETRVSGGAALELTGVRGGSATGEARVSDDEDPARIARKCSTAGLREVGIDIDIATTPAISG